MEHLGFLQSHLASLGLLGLGVNALLEAMFFPLPPDVLILLFSSFYDPLALTVTSTLGSFSGALLSYALGRRYGYPLAVRFFPREKVERASRYYQRWGVLAILVGAVTPLPFSLFVLMGGVLRMRPLPFALVCLFGRFVRYAGVAFVGGNLVDLIYRAVGS